MRHGVGLPWPRPGVVTEVPIGLRPRTPQAATGGCVTVSSGHVVGPVVGVSSPTPKGLGFCPRSGRVEEAANPRFSLTSPFPWLPSLRNRCNCPPGRTRNRQTRGKNVKVPTARLSGPEGSGGGSLGLSTIWGPTLHFGPEAHTWYLF